MWNSKWESYINHKDKVSKNILKDWWRKSDEILAFEQWMNFKLKEDIFEALPPVLKVYMLDGILNYLKKNELKKDPKKDLLTICYLQHLSLKMIQTLAKSMGKCLQQQ